jgi:hypothetical protein
LGEAQYVFSDFTEIDNEFLQKILTKE